MPLNHRCIKCRHEFHVPDKAIGKRVRCPKCKSIQNVPEPKIDSGASVRISCTACKKPLMVPDKIIGRKVLCPVCREAFIAVSEPVVSLPEEEIRLADEKMTNDAFLDGLLDGLPGLSLAGSAVPPPPAPPKLIDVLCEKCFNLFRVMEDVRGTNAQCPFCKENVFVEPE